MITHPLSHHFSLLERHENMTGYKQGISDFTVHCKKLQQAYISVPWNNLGNGESPRCSY